MRGVSVNSKDQRHPNMVKVKGTMTLAPDSPNVDRRRLSALRGCGVLLGHFWDS